MNSYLIWLEWPEKCFRADAKALRVLRDLVPKGGRVVRARTEAAFLKALPSATHAIVWNFREEWFARAPRLRLLATPAAGRELVPRSAPKGVKVHFGGFHGAVMAETVLAFMLSWCRGVIASERAGGWPRVPLSSKCYALAGTNAVVLGYGKVGKAIGRAMRAAGVSVAGITRRNACELQKRARCADWLVCALPSDTGTDGIVGRRLISSLPRRCVVINVGRGNAIDEAALEDALRRGRIAGACLDVFAGEGRGRVPPLLRRRIPNLVATPHAAAFHAGYLRDCFEELARKGLLA